MVTRPIACDIFCTVIDNFGDIGVAWRLARQLADEHAWSVRLCVDDLETFAKLAPSLNPDKRWQRLGHIVVEHWNDALTEGETLQIADVVIEAFACDLPPAYLAAMAERTPTPVWINLDYLSAEDWVADFHLKPSPHPRLPLNKWFFFPGIGPGTGGVLIERSMAARREAFQRDPKARTALLASLGIPAPDASSLVVSLFAYENPAAAPLLAQWRDGDIPVLALVPVGRLGADMARFLGRASFDATVREQRGNLTVQALPFVDHDTYDRILWSCDVNFVRGEDSFVRAQLAARPFVWHIYPQSDAAHLPKLDAALDHYAARLAPDAALALARFWHAWNGSPGPQSNDGTSDGTGAPGQAAGTETAIASTAWLALLQHRQALDAGAREWVDTLDALGGLAANLAEFAESRLK